MSKSFALCMSAAVAATSVEHCTMHVAHLIFSTKTVKVTSLQMMSGCVIVERIIITWYSSELSCFRCRLTFICLGEEMSEEEAVEFVTVNDRTGEKRLYFEVCELFCSSISQEIPSQNDPKQDFTSMFS